MSAIGFDIALVEIALHGVSQEIAETALSGLEGELARRLDALALRAGTLPRNDLAELALGPLSVAANIDAAGLRALIAEALLDHVLDGPPSGPPADEAQTDEAEAD